MKAEKPVLFVGGLPYNTPMQAFTEAGTTMGDLLLGITDGETNIRRTWVLAIAYLVWRLHPDLELVRGPKGVKGMPEYIPTGYDDLYIFRVRDGVDAIHINNMFYARDAIESYALFANLKKIGKLPRDLRFQVSIPFVEDACRLFTDNQKDMDIMIAAYIDAIKREVQTIYTAIPNNDLVIQWDVNWETIAIDHGDNINTPPLTFDVDGDPMDRFTGYLSSLAAVIPEEVKLGMHLCYGDLDHKHFLQPKDLGNCVKMANAAVKHAGRRFDYIQMPVPRDRTDDDYFSPLTELDIADTTLYIGLIHYTDGKEGCINRLNVCKKYYEGPLGIATECGMGRRPPDQDFNVLLEIHREVADTI